MSEPVYKTIPKVIHYVWVGGKPLTPLAEQCLASWQKYLPEYQIKRWDETNSPMTHPYVQAMYKSKKWAFVSDYIRFWVLAHEGGIYLDTDLELFRSINPLLNQTGFVARSKTGQIESSIIAAIPQASFIAAALSWYDADTKYSIADTSPLVLEQAIAKASGSSVTIFDHTYFHPIDEGEFLTQEARERAYGVHHWAESWVPFARTRKILRKLGVMPLLRKLRYYIKGDPV
jgi:mannosyltransferase OCH1-like enzyme